MAALCGTTNKTEEQRTNDLIEKQIRAERKKIHEVKLLLLGTGESGKSTLTKQFRIICSDGFDKDERATYRNIIHSNIIEGVATLVRMAGQFGLQISSDLQPIAAKFKEGTLDTARFLNKAIAAEVARLWRDAAIRQTFKRCSEFQLPGSVDYLLNHVERLLDAEATIENQDILHARQATHAISEIQFELDRTRFRVMDVGGQRSERKKWLQCFASVTAVIFCVALNEYNEKLFEDETVNRMTEAIQLFKEVVNNKYFNDPREPTTIIIFLNKNDLFEEKIKTEPLTTLFPDYKGGADPVAGAEYILNALLAQQSGEVKSERLIFHYVTCATDTENIRKVFNAVRMTVLHRSLEEAQVL